MAYSAVVTFIKKTAHLILIELIESDVGAADKAAIPGLPERVRIERFLSSLESGDATSIQPLISEDGSTSGNGVRAEVSADDADTQIDEQPDPMPTAYPRNKTLYWHSRPDGGTNNVVHTRLELRPG